MKKLEEKVNEVFEENFGRTPLKERIDDIMGEALELHRFTDFKNMKEEVGDLLASTIQLCNENDWNYEELVLNTLQKIQKRKLQYKTLGRKIKVAILGGAFNPPTIGHIKLAQFVLNSSKTFDEVWLMPCANHMYGKEMESAEHRLAMCKLATQFDGRIKVFDYEIKNGLSGETYKFVKSLLDEDFAKNEYDFSLIIGLDNANTLDKWVNYELLERMIRFVVVPRKGIKIDHNINWYLKAPHIFLSPDNDIPQVSSTLVRDAFARGTTENLNNFLTKEVMEYIYDNKLYNVL